MKKKISPISYILATTVTVAIFSFISTLPVKADAGNILPPFDIGFQGVPLESLGIKPCYIVNSSPIT